MRTINALLLSLVLGSVTYLNDKNELVGYDIEVGRFLEKILV